MNLENQIKQIQEYAQNETGVFLPTIQVRMWVNRYPDVKVCKKDVLYTRSGSTTKVLSIYKYIVSEIMQDYTYHLMERMRGVDEGEVIDFLQHNDMGMMERYTKGLNPNNHFFERNLETFASMIQNKVDLMKGLTLEIQERIEALKDALGSNYDLMVTVAKENGIFITEYKTA